jgi:hypothetical protein
MRILETYAMALTTILLWSMPAMPQTSLPNAVGMLTDPPPVIVESAASQPQPMPRESSVADPATTVPSATLMDISNQNRAGREATREGAPQPFPGETKP